VERAFGVHGEVRLEVSRVDVRQPAPPHDPGVVDEDVDATEALDSDIDQRRRAGRGRDVMQIGQGRSPSDLDLICRLRRGPGIGARAVDRASDVVGAPPGEQVGVGAAEPAPRPR